MPGGIFGWEQTNMRLTRVKLLAIGLAMGAIGWTANRQMIESKPSDTSQVPKLVNTCVITNDVNRLVEFYELVLMMKAKRTGDDYAEFATGVGVLAIFSAESQERYIPGSAEAATNKSMILQFRVADA